jgi:hypothetical protein
MNLIETVSKYLAEIEVIETQKRQKIDALTEWCKQNSKTLKQQMPLVGKVYEISDPKSALGYWFNSEYEDRSYYFKVKSNRFAPGQWFDYRLKYPTVKGDVIDCNYKVIEYRNDVEIGINYLTEIKTDRATLSDKYTQVYVMFDKHTGYYKIGRSVNPKFREKTLQAEKPTIELLHTYNAKVVDEKHLHTKFAEKRVRGEWFNLSGSDIAEINLYFNSEPTNERTGLPA